MNKQLILFCRIIIFVAFISGRSYAQGVFDAARKGDTTEIIKLMQLNPDTIQTVNNDGFSPLILACYHEQIAAAEFLIRHNANIDFVSPEGTALMAAVYRNETEMTKKLL